MAETKRRALIWTSVVVGASAVGVAVWLGSSAADVLLGLGTTIGLAALVFWLEQHWERRAEVIERRTDEKIEQASRAINERIDDVLGGITKAATDFVETASATDREMLDLYLANPTSDGYLGLMYRLVDLGLKRPPTGLRYATSEDPPVGTLNVSDNRLGYIGLSPDREIRPGEREARSVSVSVNQAINSGQRLPRSPTPVHAKWEPRMSVVDLMNALLEGGLPSRGHLWIGPEQFAIVLTEAIENAGWTIYKLIAEQVAGRPADSQDSG